MISKTHSALRALLFVSLAIFGPTFARAAVPQLLNHQGRIVVNGVNFEGTGQFKFALVSATGNATYWRNSASVGAGTEPGAATALTVSKGLYAVLLGDTSLANMASLPSSSLDQGDVRLRIWFNDGSRGFQQLAPDQRLAAVPFALLAAKSETAAGFEGSLAGDVTGPQGNTTISTATVTGKPLTGYLSGAGDISASDTILSAINKLNGNDGAKADVTALAAKADVTALDTAKAELQTSLAAKADVAALATKADVAALATKADVTALDVAKADLQTALATKADATVLATKADATALALKADATALDAAKAELQTALATKADASALTAKASLDGPTFTGTVSGITKSMVGLGNVTNTSDAEKPVSTAQLSALNAKASLASPTFTGTVTLPAGSTTAAPLRLTAGTSLTAATLGSVEFDGNNLYLTTNATSPSRKTVALSESGSSSQLALASIVAAPLKPVVAWGSNSDGQTLPPALANVAAVAAGNSHSIALLDDGQVVEWGASLGGVAKPALTGVTDIAAGGSHNLVRQSNGRVLAWGDNTYGQATAPTDIVSAVKVAAGARHSLALLANGTVRGWGESYLGKNAAPSSLTGMTAIAIAAGENHSLALKSTGEVVAWGSNATSQTAVPAEALSGVTAIAAGWNHNLALKSNGSVVAWGLNSGNQTAVPAAASSGVVQIAAGDTYSMALKADGTIVTWGFEVAENPVTVVPAGATQVTQIAAGGYHALALRADSVPAQVARLDQDNVFTGKVVIQGVATPGINALEVNGYAYKSTGSSWATSSDRRIKTEIESIDGALEKIDAVRLVDFRYNADYLAMHPEIENRRYPNVIAQEFQQVFPDYVKAGGQRLPDGSAILQVDTFPLTIYSAAAIQELHRENLSLKQKLADQELRLRKLEKILTDK